MIISLLVIVLVFCVGLGVGTFILEGGSSDKCVEKLDEKDNKNEDEYTVKLFNEKNENYKDISLKNEEDVENFIYVTDFYTEDYFREGLFNSDSNYSDDFMVIFTLNRLIGNLDDNVLEYLSDDFLESEIIKIFADSVNLENYHSFSYGYYGMGAAFINVACNNGLCFVDIGHGGGTDYPWYVTKIVDTRKDGDNTIYTIKEFYSDFEEGKCDIRTEKDGKVLIKNMCANVEDYDKVVAKVNPEELNTYEMTFDKDNRYVSSKKIN